MSGLLPAYILRETDNDGKMLSGGRLYFYESGTQVPKATYTTHTLDVPNTNPVILDASGSADIWLGSGAYRVLVTDAYGVQVRDPIDGVIASNMGMGADASNATAAVVRLYSDLRALITAPESVYVCGRSAIGDGGGGWFQLIPGSTLVDDDGIILTSVAGSNVYKRVFDAVINPEWYGLKYATNVNQKLYIDASLAASVQWNVPVQVTDTVYVTQNISVPSGATLNCTIGGFFTGTGNVNFTFAQGSNFDGLGTVFGSGVSAVFGQGVCDHIKLSWFGGTIDYDRWTKAVASSTYGYSLWIDVNTSVSQDISVPANFAVDFTGGSVVTVTGLTNISIANLVYTGISKIIQYNDIAYIGTLSLGSAQGCLEWYGGDSSSTDNRTAFKAALKSGNFRLLPAKSYFVQAITPYTLSTPVTIKGATGSSIQLNNQYTVGVLTLKEITLASTIFLTCSTAKIIDSSIQVAILCTAGYVTNSTVTTVSNVTKSYLSTFTAFQGIIAGNCDSSTFVCVNSIATIGSFSLNACKFAKSVGTPILFKPAVASTLTFNACDFGSITDTLFYSSPISYAQLSACTSSNNFAMPLSTSVDYMRVSLIGCGAVTNSTAWSIDGYTQDIAKYVKLQAGDPIFSPISATTQYWYGIGNPTSDGAALTLTTQANLSNDPASTSTIRYRGKPDDTSDIYQLFRYGGYVDTQIQYPAGFTPNTASKITTAIVIPNTLGISATIFHLRHNVLGVNNAANSPAVAGTTIKYRTNVWGGQTEYKVIPGAGNSAINDIWGDFAQSIAPNAKVWCIPRLVIYDQASIGLPVGTRITVTICPALPPTKEHYDRFWPKSVWGIFYDPANPITTGSLAVSSLSIPYGIGAYQLYTPYVFRSMDANGLQVALIRKPYTYGGSGPTSNALPITVWSNGTTLDSNYI